MKKLIFEMAGGSDGAQLLPDPDDTDHLAGVPETMVRKCVEELPALSEKELSDHFGELVGRNYGLDAGPCLVGGRTMRHSPRAGGRLARTPGATWLHPLQDEATAPGRREIEDGLKELVVRLLGLDRLTLEPAVEGQAELLALKVMAETAGSDRRRLLVADSAYFTGREWATGLGFQVERLLAGPDEPLVLPDLSRTEDLAGVIVSCPDCYGCWIEGLDELVTAVHAAGGLAMLEARNAAGFLTYFSPGAAGFDLVTLPLNGVLGAPHYGGGPGVVALGGRGRAAAHWAEGEFRAFGPHWPTLLRAYYYLFSIGWGGLRRATEDAVTAANYLRERLKVNLRVPEREPCLNLTAGARPHYLAETGVTVADIARRLMDYGIHPPVTDPAAVVEGWLGFEPTDSVTHQTLNEVAEAVGHVTIECNRNTRLVQGAPQTTPVARPLLDAAMAELIVSYTPGLTHSHDVGCGCPHCQR